MGKNERALHTRREFLFRSAATGAAVVTTATLPSLLISCKERETTYDTIIRGGTVYNGSSTNPTVADIGIKGNKITAVGRVEGSSSGIVDATGKAVTPGFIDVHTHCDLTFKRTGLKRHLSHIMPSWKGNHNYMYQGVTTVVTGNCGYGFSDPHSWLSMVNSVGFGTNVSHLVPHGILRQELFGDPQPSALSPAQMDKIMHHVEDAMDRGAIGMSTGLEYAPGLLSDTSELIALARVVAKKGGIYTSHIRNESGRMDKNGKPGVINALDEAIMIGREAGIPVQVSHLKIAEPIGSTHARMILERIEQARAEGLDITADQYPYAAGSTHITILLPGDLISSMGVKEQYRTRDGLKEVEKAILKVFEYLPPENILITMFPEKESLEGKTLNQAAEIMNLPPEKAYSKMVSHESAPVGVIFAQDMDVVRDIMPHEYVFTSSDGWTVPKDMTHPHPRCYGTFPRKLGKFVKEEGIMKLQHAIESMTSRPAEKFGIKNRGTIVTGNFADIAVFDPSIIMDRATYEKPHQYSTGIEYLFVNGVLSIEKGNATGDRGGTSLLPS